LNSSKVHETLCNIYAQATQIAGCPVISNASN
jgi:hypothetical protein